MKKLFLVILMMWSSVAIAAEKKPTWKYVENSVDLIANIDATIYYNPQNAQVLAETNRVLMWNLIDVIEGSTTEFREHNCEKNKYRVLTTSVYQLPMGTGNVLRTESVKRSGEANWVAIVPETYSEDLYKIACKYLPITN